MLNYHRERFGKLTVSSVSDLTELKSMLIIFEH